MHPPYDPQQQGYMAEHQDVARAWNRQTTFLQPVPLPEPPRVVYPRPLIASLSVAESELGNTPNSAKNQPIRRTMRPHPLAPLMENKSKAHSNARLATQPSSPPQFLKPAQFSTTKRPTIEPPTKHSDINAQRPKVNIHPDNSKKVINSAKTYKPPSDSKINRTQRNTNNIPSKPTSSSSSPSKRDLLEIIRRQDAELQKISMRIEELLRLQNEMRNECTQHKSRREQTAEKTTSRKTARVSSERNLDNTRCSASPQTPCSTEPYHSRYVALDDTNELENSLPETGRCMVDREDSELHFYDKVLDNVNDILVSSRKSSHDDIDLTRSSASISSPKVTNNPKKNDRDAVHVHFDDTQMYQPTSKGSQTIYIENLADKYAIKSHTKRKPTKEMSRPKRHVEKITETPYSPFEGASIATQKYLSKYGLINDSKSKQQATKRSTTPKMLDTGSDTGNSPGKRILDIDTLKKLPKLN